MKLPTALKADNSWCRSHLLRWPTLCLWNGFSLNKSTSYLSLCLSLNSFCDEASRTWASLSPETKCVVSVKRPWVQVPVWVLAGFGSRHVGSSPTWVTQFHVLWAILANYWTWGGSCENPQICSCWSEVWVAQALWLPSEVGAVLWDWAL